MRDLSVEELRTCGTRFWPLIAAALVGTVVAMVFLGLNAIRVVTAAVLGLSPSLTVVALSVATSVPALAGVALGKRLRARVTERRRRFVVLGLLTVIGVRLVLGGAGVL